jgi:hypothetical protein
VGVPWREVEVGRITETVHKSVELGCKASARASNTLALGPPFPPAACWWARTQLESAMLDSLSAPAANAASTLSNTPRLFHRVNRLCTVFHGPNRSGRSRHGKPVFATKMTASKKRRLDSSAGRPGRPRSAGSSPFKRAQSASVNSCRRITTVDHESISPSIPRRQPIDALRESRAAPRSGWPRLRTRPNT